MLRDNRRDIYLADLRSKQIEKISPELRQRRRASMVAGWRHHRLGQRAQHHAGHPDGTAVSVVKQQRLMLYDVKAKSLKDVSSATFEVEPGNPQWTNEGTRVMFISGDRAYNNAFAYDVTSGAYTRLSQRRTLNGTSTSKDGRTIVVTMDAPDSATEVYVTDPSFANLRRLTNTNPQLARSRKAKPK